MNEHEKESYILYQAIRFTGEHALKLQQEAEKSERFHDEKKNEYHITLSFFGGKAKKTMDDLEVMPKGLLGYEVDVIIDRMGFDEKGHAFYGFLQSGTPLGDFTSEEFDEDNIHITLSYAKKTGAVPRDAGKIAEQNQVEIEPFRLKGFIDVYTKKGFSISC